MKRKDFNALLLETYGKTRAEWQMYETGTEWDGSLYRKNQMYDAAKQNINYTIVPYYGGLYQGRINAFGKPLSIQIK